MERKPNKVRVTRPGKKPAARSRSIKSPTRLAMVIMMTIDNLTTFVTILDVSAKGLVGILMAIRVVPIKPSMKTRPSATFINPATSSPSRYAKPAVLASVRMTGNRNADVACSCARSLPWKGGAAPSREEILLNKPITKRTVNTNVRVVRVGCRFFHLILSMR